MMTLLVVYGAIGVCYLVLILVGDRNESADAFNLALGIDNRPVLKVLLPLLAGAMVVAVWPLGIFWQLRDVLRQRANRPRKFAVTRKDLIQKISVAEVEQLERVIDPLGAVPDVPFGFLNPAWLAFKAKLGSSQAVWAFSTQWNQNHAMEERSGYVARRWGRLGPYMLTARRLIDQDDL
jgi:hypothetical protein